MFPQDLQDIGHCRALRRLDASDGTTVSPDDERLTVMLDSVEHVREPSGGFRGGDLLHGIRLSDFKGQVNRTGWLVGYYSAQSTKGK